MKNRFYIFIVGLLILLSCSNNDNEITYVDTAQVSFKTVEGADLFVEDNSVTPKTYFVEIGLATVADVDRTVDIEVIPVSNYKGVFTSANTYKKDDVVLYDNRTYIALRDVASGGVINSLTATTWKEAGLAIEGFHYSISKTLIIPKGEYVGKCIVVPNFNNLVSSFLSVKISIKTDSAKDIAGYRKALTFKLFKFIPFDEAKILGTYTNFPLFPNYGKTLSYNAKEYLVSYPAIPVSEYTVTKGTKVGEYILTSYFAEPTIINFVYNNKADYHTLVNLDNKANIIWKLNQPIYGDVYLVPSGAKGELNMNGPVFSIKFDAKGSNSGYFVDQPMFFFKKK